MPDMKRVGVLLVALVMTGCSGGGSTIPDASTTASSATPSVSKSVSPSEDPLYLEAVAVYKKLLAEERKLMLAGGADALPESMRALLAEPARSDLKDSYSALKESGVRQAASPAPVVRLEPNPGVTRAGSVVSLTACEDASRVPMLLNGKEVAKGDVIERSVFFTRASDGALVVAALNTKVVKTCA